MKKAAFLSIGCKTNQYEIEALKESVKTAGFEITDFNKRADVYIINTCTVTNEAARKSKQMIRRAQGKDAVICVMGCYSELNRDEIAALGDVLIVAGTDNRSRIAQCLSEAVEQKKQIVLPTENQHFEETGISSFSDKTRAYIKIEDGCDSYCSYCIIPYARGKVRSRAPEKIVEEAKRLSRNGFSEIVLTGINICRYDHDGIGLTDLLGLLDDIEGITRIRLGSVYPDYIDTRVSDELGKIKKLCPHFHISLQSGSDKILQYMGRKYSVREAYHNLEYLITKKENTLLTADVIVGFPHETEDDFCQTVAFILKLPFYHVHVFKYSKREGTKAALMEGQIPYELKNKRSDTLMEISRDKKKAVIKGYTGKKTMCLFESQNGSDFLGHSDNYMDIICRGRDLSGQMAEVIITGHENGRARAEVVK